MPELRGSLDGRLITPEHPEYDAARTVLLSAVDRRPAAIVEVASAADVARVVTVAREPGLPLAVRGGGHSFAGHSVCDDGIVIDLRGMRGLDIAPTRGRRGRRPA